MSEATDAYVLAIGSRYFTKFSKDGRVQTAWSLAGATLFGGWRHSEIQQALDRIKAKRPQADVQAVTVTVAQQRITVARDELRRKFETWARLRTLNLLRDGEQYHSPSTQTAWEAWQAAMAW